MFRKAYSCVLLVILISASALMAQTARHPLRLDDMPRFRDVRDPQLSPDGKWLAYVVGTTDTKEDKSSSHIWLAALDGSSDR